MQDLQNIEAECGILRLILHKNDVLAQIDGRIKTDDFYSLANQTIYNALLEMYDKNIKADLVTLPQYLVNTGKMENVGKITYITELYDGLVNPAGIEEYIKIVRDYSDRRKLWKLGEWTKNKVHDKTAETDKIKSVVVDSIEKLTPQSKNSNDGLFRAFESLSSNKKEGLDTGYANIDRTLQGMKEGNFIVLAGRPAMGKTALALNILKNVCVAGKSVLFFSLEMSDVELNKRLLLMVSGQNENVYRSQSHKDEATSNNIFDNEVKRARDVESQKVWGRLQNALNEIGKWKLEIVEEGIYSIQDMRLKAKIKKKKEGLDLIIIDYLQLMSANESENRTAEITAITRGLKNLAKELKIPILVLSQLNRGVETRQDKRPTLADLRDSGSIEQDADSVMIIYRDKYYNENGNEWTEVNVAKNRHSGGGVCRLMFYPEVCRFVEYTGIGGKAVNKKIVEGVFK